MANPGAHTIPFVDRIVGLVVGLPLDVTRLIAVEGTEDSTPQVNLDIPNEGREQIGNELARSLLNMAADAGRTMSLRFIALADDKKKIARTIRIEPPVDGGPAQLLARANDAADTAERVDIVKALLQQTNSLLNQNSAMVVMILQQAKEQMQGFTDLMVAQHNQIAMLVRDRDAAERHARAAHEQTMEATQVAQTLSQQVEAAQNHDALGEMIKQQVGPRIAGKLGAVVDGVMDKLVPMNGAAVVPPATE